MKSEYYNLTVICDGAILTFVVDEVNLKSFERSFDSEEEIIEFIDMEDKGTVKLRNRNLVGYKKAVMDVVPTELRGQILGEKGLAKRSRQGLF